MSLFIAVISLSVGYASLSENLLISGEAYLRVKEDVRIIDFKYLESTDGGCESFGSRYSKNGVTLGVILPKLTSTVTYEVTIENKTDNLYIISKIEDTLTNENIKYEILDYKIGQGLSSKDTTKIRIKLKYKEDLKNIPSNTTETKNITFEFERPNAYELSYQNEQYTECRDVQCALDELYGLMR